jgi:hypothetical protein
MYHHKLRSLMADQIFGIDEWQHLLEVAIPNAPTWRNTLPLSEEQLDEACPFDSSFSVKDTHFAFLTQASFRGERFTLWQWEHSFGGGTESSGQVLFFGNRDYECARSSANGVCNDGWNLVHFPNKPRNPAPKESTSIAEIVNLLPKGYRLPTTIECVTALVMQGIRNSTFYDEIFCTSSTAKIHGYVGTDRFPRPGNLLVRVHRDSLGGCVVSFGFQWPEDMVRGLGLLAVRKNVKNFLPEKD